MYNKYKEELNNIQESWDFKKNTASLMKKTHLNKYQVGGDEKLQSEQKVIKEDEQVLKNKMKLHTKKTNWKVMLSAASLFLCILVGVGTIYIYNLFSGDNPGKTIPSPTSSSTVTDIEKKWKLSNNLNKEIEQFEKEILKPFTAYTSQKDKHEFLSFEEPTEGIIISFQNEISDNSQNAKVIIERNEMVKEYNWNYGFVYGFQGLKPYIGDFLGNGEKQLALPLYTAKQGETSSYTLHILNLDTLEEYTIQDSGISLAALFHTEVVEEENDKLILKLLFQDNATKDNETMHKITKPEKIEYGVGNEFALEFNMFNQITIVNNEIITSIGVYADDYVCLGEVQGILQYTNHEFVMEQIVFYPSVEYQNLNLDDKGLLDNIDAERIFMGYISKLDIENNTIDVDEVEWLTYEDAERCKELGIVADWTGGFYIYNPKEDKKSYKLTNDVEYHVLYGAMGTYKISKEEFISQGKYTDAEMTHPFHFAEKDGKIMMIVEQYVP